MEYKQLFTLCPTLDRLDVDTPKAINRMRQAYDMNLGVNGNKRPDNLEDWQIALLYLQSLECYKETEKK